MKYRKRLAAVLLTAATLTACRERSFTAEPVDYVSTLVGTMSKPSLSTGNTYPAVARPWGTHFWPPPDWAVRRRLDLCLYRRQDPGLQADPPAQPVDERLRLVQPHARHDRPRLR